MPRRIQVGAIGAASIVKKNLIALSKADGIELVALGSRSLAKSEALLSEMASIISHSAKAYGSYEEVISLPGLDAIYIPLPSAMHVTWVRLAAEKGLHILLEKPIAANMLDLDEIMTICKKHGVQLMDGTMWMHNPRTKVMERTIRNKEMFGDVIDVTSTFAFQGDETFMSSDIRMKASCDPLGCLGDLGWYCIRAALWAYDWETPDYVAAHPGAALNSEGVPSFVGFTLIWPGPVKRRATITCSFDQPLKQTLDISGSKGRLHLRDIFLPSSAEQLTFTTNTNNGLNDYWQIDVTNVEEHLVMMNKPQETFMWESFASCIRHIRDEGGQPDEFWSSISRLTQRVVIGVYSSMNDGCSIVKMADV